MAHVHDSALWLADKLPSMEEALATLVNVNSFTDNVEGGRKVAALLAELFTGLDATKVASSRYADHLVFKTKGKSGTAPISLVGHLDTVFPPGTFETRHATTF